MTTFLIWVIAGFVLGSIPFGLLLTKIFHGKDIRQEGSGNIGTTNVSRAFGFWPAGALTLILDILKAALPLSILLHPDFFGSSSELSSSQIWGVGFATLCGHCFSPWLKLQGGKGVATGLGILVALSPWAALAGITAFALGFLSTRVGSVGSLSGVWVALSVHWALVGDHSAWLLSMVILITLRHASNLDRLAAGQENRF